MLDIDRALTTIIFINVVFWPIAIFGFVFRWMGRFATAPVERRRKQSKSFAQKADEAEKLIRDKAFVGDAETRKAFEEIVADYRATAKKLDL